MSEPEWLDESGEYPSDAALERIKAWPWEDVFGCLDFVASIWHWPDFGVSHELRPEEYHVCHTDNGDRFLRLATGGWSGNEDIVGALELNWGVQAMAWQLSGRGGLHIFKYPERPKS